MNTCDACKWWRGKVVVDPRYGNLWAYCASPNLYVDQRVEGNDGNARIASGNDIPLADLITGPKFGCLHWEAK